jgi:hypothetical protein
MNDGPAYVLPAIPYLVLQFNLIAAEEAQLPSFKGSVLRGAFGNALRRTVCVMGPKQPCSDCFLNRQCVNTKIFETFIFEEPPRFLRGLNTAPKPFLLFCPDERRKYEAGEILSFEMTLIGKAIEQHPFIIFAVQKMAERGLGSRRHKFHLQEVFYRTSAGGWQQLYDGNSQKLTAAAEPSLTRPHNHPQPPEKLTLRFVSPTRLKFERELSLEFDFRQLLFRLLRRPLELAHFYAPQEKINWEFNILLVLGNTIEITEKNLQWKDLNRYSARQKAEMYFGGFVGDITLQGILAPFMDILRAGEILHVGKATTFGLGKVEVEAGG